MGYTTEFEGEFLLDRELDDMTYDFLYGLANTRRMKRDISKLPKTGFEKYGFDSWGVEGEFYIDRDYSGQREGSIIDHNREPSTQPGLWCQWVPDIGGERIKWDGGEKFYNYIEWLEYIIEKVLAPRKYKLNGIVSWQGERPDDFGQIKVENNEVFTRLGKIGYGEWK